MPTFWKVFISIIITIAVVGGGTFYVMQRQINSIRSDNQTRVDDLNKQIKTLQSATSSTTATTPTTTDETAGWKTYTNTTYGFSFKYPSNLTKTDASSYTANDGAYIDDSSSPDKHIFSVEAEQSSLSLDAYIAKAETDAVFNGKTALTIAGQTAYEGIDSGLINQYGILVKKGNYIFHIVLDASDPDTLVKAKSSLSATQKTILSTFQFTK